MKPKVVVGMSGGVDSSVAALLLKEEGYEVIGVTMQIWQEDEAVEAQEGGCCGLSAVDDARRVAHALEIPHYVMNFRQPFQEKVIDYFVQAYMAGETPNPCIACNRYVKWESLLERAIGIGADYIATGHYARIKRLDNGRYVIGNAATAQKDQTYALYNLTQEQLKRTLMPVGDYDKPTIRDKAMAINVRIANKPDSQEICFVPDDNYGKFIEDYTGKNILPGDFVDPSGKVIGRHKGIIHYTIGQRKGLGLALAQPGYVMAIEPEKNQVVVGTHEDVFTEVVYAKDLNWMAINHLEGERHVMGKIRYNQSPVPCSIKMVNADTLECRFPGQVRAATPGQALVLYEMDYVLGGGTIIKTQ